MNADCGQKSDRRAWESARAAGERVAKSAADLVGRDHAPQPPVRVDGHEPAEAAQRVVAEQGLERGVVADPQRPGGVQLEHLADGLRGAARLRDIIGGLADQQAAEVIAGVDDREPGPAVAEEVLVDRALDARVLG